MYINKRKNSSNASEKSNHNDINNEYQININNEKVNFASKKLFVVN